MGWSIWQGYKEGEERKRWERGADKRKGGKGRREKGRCVMKWMKAEVET